MKGKIKINVTLIWFKGAGKTIPFKSVLEFSIISDFKMRNVIVWHYLLKALWAHDVEMTLRRIDIITTSCACWEFAPPLAPPQYSKSWPPNIRNLPTPMQGLSEPEFYGDLVYKYRKIIGKYDFPYHFKKIVFCYKKIGYNINVWRQTACLVVNPIRVDILAYLFDCMTVGRAPD